MMSEKWIILGGGCFWCLEAAFSRIKGVTKVESGYSGGSVINPTYQMVCTGKSGHAEVVRVNYRPDQIQLEQLLKVFFTLHDPTTLNQQGADVGEQYRSVIYYESDEQKQIAKKVIEEMTKQQIWPNPIVTQLLPADSFYPAEAEHIRYYDQNQTQGYCQAMIAPKLVKLRQTLADLWQEKPVDV